MNDIVSIIKKDKDCVCNHPARSETFSFYLLVLSFFNYLFTK